ncbi:MAG: RNA chaperone Hfq, partial [Oscillospiraceae bacterium]|nr:RNA chaperone Hfq [Oscillospiraceae bacterium]
QMRGIITAFDPYVVVVVSDGKQQVIYKHAISTIAPEHPLELEP